jgi:cytochrome c1
MHDGSAITLLDVLTTANPADEHGATSHLTEQELADLVAFLSALPFTEQESSAD